MVSANEFGDEVVLGAAPWDTVISGIKLDYYVSTSTLGGLATAGNETARIRLYDNTTPTTGTPGNLLYDSGSFAIGKAVNPSANYGSINLTGY